MIRAYIDIDGDSRTRDTLSEYNMTYIDSDDIFAPPVKELEATSYAEESGEHCDPRTAYAPFDFHINYLVYSEPAPLRNLVRNAMPRGVESVFDVAAEMPSGWRRGNEYLATRYNHDGVFEAKHANAWTQDSQYASIFINLSEPLTAGETYTLRFVVSVRGLTEGAVRIGWNCNYNKVREVRLTKNGDFNETLVFQPHNDLEAGAKQDAHLIMDKTNAGVVAEIKAIAIYKGRHSGVPCYIAPEDLINLNRAVTRYNADVTKSADKMIECRRITVSIPYKGLKIVGLAKPIANEDVTKFSRIRGYDTCIVTTTIHVDDPTLCDFCLM